MTTQHISSRTGFVVVMSVIACFSGWVEAQTPRAKSGVNIRHSPSRQTRKVPVASRVSIETSAPVTNLLRRGEDAISREDWKLAIDSLQRVIEAPDGSLVPFRKNNQDSTTIYQSASRYAASQIAHLPPEGLAAYRLLYDGKAKRLHDQAMATHQADGLWTIAHLYTGTRYGSDALETLASWALDENRPELALRLLYDLRSLVPTQEQDIVRLATMEAVAQAMIGSLDHAYETMTPYIPKVSEQGLDNPWRRLVVHSVSTQAKDRYAIDNRNYNSWPMMNGQLVGNGRLPGVSPEITSTAPWRYELDERNFRSSVNFGGKPSHKRLAFPFYRFAILGDRILLRTRRGCVALDADDLSILWHSPSLENRFSGYVGIVSSSAGSQLERTYESVAGDIVVEGHHIYTIEPALSRIMGNHVLLAPPRVAQPALRGAKNSGSSSRLVSRDVETGEISWTRGGGHDPLDPLSDVRFRSVPIIVDSQMWVPYERQRELYLAVLDPTTGKDIAHIFLCSAPASSRRLTVPLTPAYDSGVIYVASGYGLFYAIDVTRREVIWAHRLDGHYATMNSGGMSWEAGTPVVARGLVFFPSLVDGSLYALDVLDGSRVWSRVVAHTAFIVAADAKHVWLAGQTMTCLETGSGKEVWTRELPFTQTGRPALVGHTVLIPAITSVLALDEITGELVKDYTLAEKQHPLGDIVSYHSSLYSVDPSFVRRFPDLSDMYPTAKARLLDNPEDDKTRLQLARLEILRGEPELAISLLESTEARFDGVHLQMRAHALVDSWLLMASEGKGEPGQMMRALDQAEKQATTNAQSVRVALVKSHWQQAGNDRVGAARTIWKSAASLPDDKNIEIGGLAKGAAQLVLRRELFEVVRTMDRASKDEFERYANIQLTDILAQYPISKKWSETCARSLRAISELGAPPATAQRALLENAKRNLLHGRFELAEHDLVVCAGMNSSERLARSAVMYLIKMHTQVLHSPPSAAEPWILALMKSSPHALLPPSYEWFDMFGPKPSTTSTLSAWLMQNSVAERESLSGNPLPAPRQQDKHASHSWIYVPHDLDSNANRSVHRLGHRRGEIDDAGFVPVIVFMREDRIAALHPKTGQVMWEADMRFPEMFPYASIFMRNNQRGGRANQARPKRSFVVDGQVVVVVSREGLSGIGLFTGKRLWTRPFDLLPPMTKPELRDSALAARDGMIAAMPTGGRLSLMRSADGSTVWERDMYGEMVEHIWLTPTRVITADARKQRVHIINREDGRLIRQVLFGQPDEAGKLVSLVMVDDHIYGPTHTARVDGVMGVSIISGEDVWQRELDRPLVQLFGLDEHTIGVVLLGGGGYTIDTTMGYESTSFFIERIARLMDLHLIGDSLIAVYPERVNRRQAISMKAISLSTGEERWVRKDLAVVRAQATKIRVQGATIYAVLESLSGPRSQEIQYRVAAINADTGAEDGWREQLPRTSSRPNYRFDGDLNVSRGAVVVGVASAIHGFVLGNGDKGLNETEVIHEP